MPNPRLDLSIVIPTYNEAKNVPFLVEEIFGVLSSLPHVDAELIIVDDNSPDGTGQIAEALRGQYSVQVIHRAGKFGLGSAVMEGFRLSTRPYLGVMDADLSHDPSVLPEMLSRLADHDIVIGSRFDPDSRMEGRWPLSRKTLSLVGVYFAKLITRVSDPLSGYFFTKREVLKDVELTSPGYKILFEILAKGEYSSVCDVPFVFRSRRFSSSKLGFKEYALFAKQVVYLGLPKLRRRRTEPRLGLPSLE
ncbi:MAG: polyprenol monophosphomannose synthase [Gemmatimonadetes bacterium]|nr:polyprenol monophosphomannose synthase [Gemmatimonadota bacterium]